MTIKQLERIVRWWTRRLGLTHWDITVMGFDEWNPESSAHVYVWRARDYDEALIYFNPKDAPDWGTVEAHRHVAAHLHAVEQAVDRLACRLVELADIRDRS